MPIPDLNDDGVLPPGVHDCTVEEISETFGVFRRSDRRLRLTRHLSEYVGELRQAGVAQALIVDGSYVTSKEKPDDIDLLLILRDDLDLGVVVPPFEYNQRSQRYLKKRYEFDFFFGFSSDPSSEKMVEVFRRVKDRPEVEKGMLRIVF